MLTDKQYEAIGNAAAAIFQALEKRIILSVARRLKELGDWLTEAAKSAAKLRDGGAASKRAAYEARRALTGNEAYRKAVSGENGTYRREVSEAAKKAAREAIGEALVVLPMVAEWVREENRKAGQHASDELPADEPENQDIDDDSDGEPVQTVESTVQNELSEIARSSAFRVCGVNTPLSRVFQKAVDESMNRMLNGEISIDEAVRQVVGDMAANGMRTVTYTESGRTIVTHTDVAARRCLQTAAAQTAARATMADCRRMGANHVEVSAHWGARTDGIGGHADHEAWQGRVYQIDGSSDEYPNLEEKTGYPSDPLGLCGYNCRHSMSPFWPGASTPNQWQKEPGPKAYRGKEYGYYEATQRMRKFERDIRAEKRKDYGEKAAGGPGVPKSLKGERSEPSARNGEAMKREAHAPAVRGAGRKVEMLKDEYRDFCKAMEIRPAWNRTTIEGEKPDFKRIFGK